MEAFQSNDPRLRAPGADASYRGQPQHDNHRAILFARAVLSGDSPASEDVRLLAAQFLRALGLVLVG